MKKHLVVIGIFLIGSVCLIGQSLHVKSEKPAFVKSPYTELPLGTIKPAGWLLGQLKIMRDGTSGHLDEVYDKVKISNGWLGGTGDGWEETPYWLDGAVPLAYLLNDKPLIEKVQKYIHWTLSHQRPSGYFGPITPFERDHAIPVSIENPDKGDDWWPKMVMLKVLQQYYSVSGDTQVLTFMSNYFKYQWAVLKTCPIGKWSEWAQSRGTENILVAQWLYSLTHDDFLLKLCNLIESQSFAWSSWMGNRDWVIHAAAYQDEQDWMHRHGVNVAMGLKSPALNFERTGDSAFLTGLKTGFNDLMTLHGLPMGVFSADEDLHGNDPTQGTEFCAIVESMFSLEEIIRITGDVSYMDALEKMTFNALPTQTTDDYNAKQYFQIANQVQVDRGVYNFSLPFDRMMNNVFGMCSGYTCCLANMHQGWTKFTQHLWYGTLTNGLAAVEFAPCDITTPVGLNHDRVHITENTTYPFGNEVQFKLSMNKPVEFPFQIRIPGWCREGVIKLNGVELEHDAGGQMITIKRLWLPGDNLSLTLPMDVKISKWGRNSRAVNRGPLVYALKVKERWVTGHEKSEGDYFSVFPEDDWNFALLSANVQFPANGFKVSQNKPVTESFVWNSAHAPIEITTSGRKIPTWKLTGGIAPQPVNDRSGIYKGEVSDSIVNIILIPYGCTKLRVVAFPVAP